MRKWAFGQILDAQVHPRTGLIKDAARHEFQYEPRQGYLYVPSRMISSRVNDNWDGFPAEQIADTRPGYGWQTFLGKPAFVNHHNANHRKMRGVIVDAVLHEHRNPDGSPDTWVEGLHEIDGLTYPKLARAILAKKIERTSMGVDVDYSICSACGNKAVDTFSYCQHIPGQKGRKFFASGQPGRYIYEVCHGLKFFENSLLVEPPADPTAYVTGSAVAGPGLEHLTAGLQRTASRERINVVSSFRTVDAGPQFAELGLTLQAARYSHPSEHPWFQANPVHPDNIVSHWNQATPDEKASGKRWYADAHLVGKSIAKLAPVRPGKKESDADARHPLGDAHLGASALAIYSPQQGWAGNMHNAARALHEGKGIGGPGSGMFASKSQATSMDKVLGGAHMHEAVSGPKIRDFGHLIEHGGDEHPPEHPDYQAHVVIDRHALGVAAGKRLSNEDYGSAPVAAASRRKDGTIPRSAGYDHVVDAYHQASKRISDQEGEHVPGHAVQATTWLVRQRLNQEGEKGATGNDVRLNKGRQVSRTKAEDAWEGFRNEHGIEQSGPGTGYTKESSRGRRPFARARKGTRRTAYGEQVAPPKVDTLREESCPICGEDNAYDGSRCRVCGYVAPPSPFNDPNLDKAKQIDLRQEQQAYDQTQIPDPDRAMADESGGTLICPACGTQFPQEPPESVDTDEAAPDVAAGESEEGMGAAEGDLCPVCGEGVLEAQGTVEDEEAAEGAVDPEVADQGGQVGEDEEEPPVGGGEAEPDDEDEKDQPGVAVKSTDGPLDDEADDEDPDDEDDAPPVPKSKKKPNQ